MDYFFSMDTWKRLATNYMKIRDKIDYIFDSGVTVTIEPVGGKSVRVKVDNSEVGAAGTGGNLVDVLCETIGKSEHQGEMFRVFMGEIFYPYDNDDDL